MLNIFKKYLEKKKLDDQSKFFAYDIIDKVKSAKLMPLHAEYLASDFMEVINRYHEWTTRMLSWAAWNDMLNEFIDDDEKSWEIRYEFLEPIVFFCLHQPSSFKDLLVKYCTVAFHFGNLNRFPNYKDKLLEDDEVFRRLQNNHPEPYKYFLSRGKAEKQLIDISLNWTVGAKLTELISKLDDKDYEMQSQGWRNHAAHYIPPRLNFGHTRTVTRYVQFSEKTSLQNNGDLRIEVDRRSKQVTYGFGYTPPLDSEKIFQANFQQHLLANKVLVLIHDLLDEIASIRLIKKLDRLNSASDMSQFPESIPIGEEFGARTS